MCITCYESVSDALIIADILENATKQKDKNTSYRPHHPEVPWLPFS